MCRLEFTHPNSGQVILNLLDSRVPDELLNGSFYKAGGNSKNRNRNREAIIAQKYSKELFDCSPCYENLQPREIEFVSATDETDDTDDTEPGESSRKRARFFRGAYSDETVRKKSGQLKRILINRIEEFLKTEVVDNKNSSIEIVIGSLFGIINICYKNRREWTEKMG